DYAAKYENRWVERIRDFYEQKLVSGLIARVPLSDLTLPVLDLPCGIGRFLPVLHARVPRVIEGDWSNHMLQFARSKHEKNVLGFVRASTAALPFAEQSFDLVFSVRLCHHFPTTQERAEYIREMLRISRRWVILTYLDKHSTQNTVRSMVRRLKGKRLKWSMTKDEIAETAAEQGFTVVHSVLLSRFFSGQRYAILQRNAQVQCNGLTARNPLSPHELNNDGLSANVVGL
ncbi:MAG: class I SAM-dependent methyltransferase, partial [Candidatus Hydrogenedentes bacterium]|nr:class I SAM-dependent methyltransferase [Candidatus Hydrogenedentota bacterium]